MRQIHNQKLNINQSLKKETSLANEHEERSPRRDERELFLKLLASAPTQVKLLDVVMSLTQPLTHNTKEHQ